MPCIASFAATKTRFATNFSAGDGDASHGHGILGDKSGASDSNDNSSSSGRSKCSGESGGSDDMVLEDSPEQLHGHRAFYRQCVAEIAADVVHEGPIPTATDMLLSSSSADCRSADDTRALSGDMAAAGSLAAARPHSTPQLKNL